MVANVGIKVCSKDRIKLGGQKERSFFDIYERKLKHLLELESDGIQSLNKCYEDPSKAHQDIAFIEVLNTALTTMFD